MKIWACLGETTPSKFDEICPLAIPYQISTISIYITYQVWLKSIDIYTSYHPERKISAVSWGDNSVKFHEVCPLASPYKLSTISIHIPSLVKIHWYSLKLSSWNENMGVSWGDNSVKIWWNLPISNLIQDLQNINPHIKFGENPLIFTQVIILKQKYGHVLGR